jgi:hypothetical protein
MVYNDIVKGNLLQYQITRREYEKIKKRLPFHFDFLFATFFMYPYIGS